MTFDFGALSAGAPARSIRNHLWPSFLDQMPEDATDAQIAHDYGYHLIWQMQNPKMMKTVRKHLLRDFAALEFVAELQPEVFDEVLMAYAERAMAFEQPHAA